MNTQPNVNSPSRVTQLLAVWSVATFWLFPLSPFITMAAVSRTSNTIGWPRTMSVAATYLCMAYVVVLASWLAIVYFWLLPG